MSLFDTSDFERCPTCKGTRQVQIGKTGDTRPCPTCTQPPPPQARTTDPETSHAAAASLSVETVRRSQDAVLRLIEASMQRGMTDAELEEAYPTFHRHTPLEFPKQSPSGLRTRRHELVERGLVMDSGERRALPSGRTAIVWRVVPH